MVALKRAGLTALRAQKGQMNETQQRIAAFLEHRCRDIESVFTLTAGIVALEVETSKATVVRFAQWLGYAGFPELQVAILHELVRNQKDEGDEETDLPPRLLALRERTSRSLVALEDVFDAESYRTAVSWIREAETIIWCGLGDSGNLAASCHHKALMVDLISRLTTRIEELRVLSRRLGEKDVLVVISQSGQWTQYRSPITLARRGGARVILITSNLRPAIGDVADLILYTTAFDIPIADDQFTVRGPQALLLDALLLDVAEVGGVDLS